jgi:HDOD domain
MDNQTRHGGFNQSWVPSNVLWSFGLQKRPVLLRERSNCISDTPVMLATVLGLELLLQEPSIDLRMASDLVLSDVGATLQVLQLVGDEYSVGGERLCRMDDCLASLDVDAWFSKVSARTFANGLDHMKTTVMWKHCHLIAQYSQLVAESLKGVSPEQAYLVGLLHEIETISDSLGWNKPFGALEPSVMEGVLPPFVHAALSSMAEGVPSIWKFVLSAAHDLARTDFDSSILPDERFTGFVAF